MGTRRTKGIRGTAGCVLLTTGAGHPPRPGLPYQLWCDVSDFAVSHSLWQLHTLPDTTTVWRPIEFRSMSFNTSERSRAAHARELLSFIGGLKYFRPFLSGVPFSVITDASALA